MNNIKDTLTSIFAIVALVAGAVNAYLQSNTGNIDWFQLAIAVVVAIVGYYTGKNSNGTVKEEKQLTK